MDDDHRSKVYFDRWGDGKNETIVEKPLSFQRPIALREHNVRD